VLSRERCALVGGHTSEGAEAALGMSVTGVVHPDRVFHKGQKVCLALFISYLAVIEIGPLKIKTALVLTKALGTGTIMAADMRYAAKGRWVKNCIDSMIQTNSTAAKVLSNFSCSACTDVTGFGLIGHLIEMIQFGEANLKNDTENNETLESGLLSVDLYMNRIPLLLGAVECVKSGIFSSLHPQNIRCARVIGNVNAAKGNFII
jgi:selenide,water dikinase